MNAYDIARGLHILAVIAWMAGLLFLPRLYAYDVEQNAKPEPLRGHLSGFWSRRIDRTHRLVYLYEQDTLTIVQCRYHYDDR